MKYKNPNTGKFDTLYVKALDSMPVGTQVEYNGQDIPAGWQEVEDKGEVYSTEEVRIGTWIDEKPLYRCTVSCGALPNNSVKIISTGISNIDKVVNLYGYSTDGSAYIMVNQPRESVEASNSCFYIKNDGTYTNSLRFRTNTNRSSYTETYVTLEYTKTTDTVGGAE